jgi:hypothetical protein
VIGTGFGKQYYPKAEEIIEKGPFIRTPGIIQSPANIVSEESLTFIGKN